MGNHCNCIGRPRVDDDAPLLPGYVTENTVQIRGPPPPYEVSVCSPVVCVYRYSCVRVCVLVTVVNIDFEWIIGEKLNAGCAN